MNQSVFYKTPAKKCPKLAFPITMAKVSFRLCLKHINVTVNNNPAPSTFASWQCRASNETIRTVFIAVKVLVHFAAARTRLRFVRCDAVVLVVVQERLSFLRHYPFRAGHLFQSLCDSEKIVFFHIERGERLCPRDVRSDKRSARKLWANWLGQRTVRKIVYCRVNRQSSWKSCERNVLPFHKECAGR